MNTQPVQQAQMLRTAYAAYNARNINGALDLMTTDVTWPMASNGGYVHGPDEVRAYWTERWSEVDPQVDPLAFYPQSASQMLVQVHQVVLSLAGTVLVDDLVGHLFTISNGLIQAMEIWSPSSVEAAIGS